MSFFDKLFMTKCDTGGKNMLFQKFQNGINLGGWLSQYEIIIKESYSREDLKLHLKTFLNENDFHQISEWGFDHVRLPVSGYFLYDMEKETLNAEPLAYIDQCIDWCRDFHLNLILDLHDFWGNVYGAMDTPMPLLTDKTLQHHFTHIWELLTQHLKNVKDITILFELLNEVSDATCYLWNRMYKCTVHAIRELDTHRPVLIGSNCQNSVTYLSQLDLSDDPLVFYNFHYYEPLVFTHQKAHFSEEMREFNQTVTYPGDMSSFIWYLSMHPEYKTKYPSAEQERMNDHELMKKLLKHAVDFVSYSGKELYCGELGVIDSAPPEEAAKWISDLLSILTKNQIGHAIWNYKGLDFGLLDLKGNAVSGKLLQAITSYNHKCNNSANP